MARRAIIAVILLGIAALPAAAQEHKPEHKRPAATKAAAKDEPATAGDPVVARVNGTVIHRSDIMALRATLPAQLQQQPLEQIYPRLVDQIVAMTLVSQAARKEKLDEDAHVKEMEAISDKQILQDAYFNGVMHKEITDERLKERYDQFVKSAPVQDEVHARHILVPTEAEAKEIIEELKKGADFAKLASEKTTDPAGKTSGGDLGYFTQSEMVPEFAKAAFALKNGQFTQTPVKTQFGWHVIKVEDRRQGKPPPFDQVKSQIARQMAQEIYGAKVKELAAVATIEVYNADGSKRTPAPAPAPAAAPTAQSAPTPSLIPLQNGTPGGPPPAMGTPTLAPGTENLGK